MRNEKLRRRIKKKEKKRNFTKTASEDRKYLLRAYCDTILSVREALINIMI